MGRVPMFFTSPKTNTWLSVMLPTWIDVAVEEEPVLLQVAFLVVRHEVQDRGLAAPDEGHLGRVRVLTKPPVFTSASETRSGMLSR